jgi:S1-C subfamily serine protease
MKRITSWACPALMAALAVGLCAFTTSTVAQSTSNTSGEQRQSEQGTASTNTGGQSGSQSSSQSTSSGTTSSNQSNTNAGNQSTNNQSTNAGNTQTQSANTGNQTSNAQTGSAAQAQGQAQTSQQTQTDQRSTQAGAGAAGQAGVDARSNVQGTQPSRDAQSRNVQNQSVDVRQRSTNIGVQFGAATGRGITVNSVERNSVFFTSGLRQGDVIISVSGRPIRSQADFVQFVSVGQRVPVVVLRDGRQETIYITYEADLAVPQPPIGGQQGAALLGVTFDTQVPNAAVVLSVNPGSPAAQAGISAGDEIVSINGQRITSYQNAIQVVGMLRPGDQAQIEFLHLQQAQVVLQPSGPRTAAGVRVDQGVQQSSFQERAQGQSIEGQTNRVEGRIETENRQQTDRSQNQGQRRSLLPRIRD